MTGKRKTRAFVLFAALSLGFLAAPGAAADGQNLPAFTGEKVVDLGSRETLVFEAAGRHALGDGLFLSEIPARIHVAEEGLPFPEVDPEIHQGSTPGQTRGNGEWPAYGGWGGAQADASPYSTALSIADRPFRYGLGVMANSRIEVLALGQHDRFAASVGVDNATRNRISKVEFLVYGDGRLLAQTKALAFGDPAVEVSANIAGVKVVELVARSGDAGAPPVAVAWGNARFTD